MTTMHTRSRLPRQEFLDTAPVIYPAEASTEIGADELRNAKPLPYYWAEFCLGFWRGMSDGARFVFWLLMAILLVAAAWHVAARLAALT